MARIGGSTFSFMWRASALEAMRRMAVIGLNDFDVLLSPGHLWWEELSAGQRAELRTTLEREGLRVESLNLPALDYNLASVVPEVRRRTVDAYRQSIELAADLGARAVVVVPGRVSGLLAPPLTDSLAWLTNSAAELVAAAGRLDTRLHFELHPQTPVPTANALGEWISAFDTDVASIAYDVANAEFIGEDQAEAIRRWGHRIGQYHLSDGTRTAWRHDAIGAGTVRFGPIMEAIGEQAGDAVAILELITPTPEPDMKAGLARLADAH